MIGSEEIPEQIFWGKWIQQPQQKLVRYTTCLPRRKRRRFTLGLRVNCLVTVCRGMVHFKKGTIGAKVLCADDVEFCVLGCVETSEDITNVKQNLEYRLIGGLEGLNGMDTVNIVRNALPEQRYKQ